MKKGKIKIVKILGGLGNQMFQYALYIALKETFMDCKLYIDKNLFTSYKLHNGFELDKVFQINYNEANIKDIKKFTWYTNSYFMSRILTKFLPPKKYEYRERLDFDQRVLQDDNIHYYSGYWQNWRYFHKYSEIIKKEFTFKISLDERNLKLLEYIKSNANSTSIHIRRGDYLKDPLYFGICNISYYKRVIQEVTLKFENPAFFLFSNDIEWCKSNIYPLIRNFEVTIIDWNIWDNSYIDMQLMSACRINIIANSSFSWWAAYLNSNKHKIVYAPKVWINSNIGNNCQLNDWNLF